MDKLYYLQIKDILWKIDYIQEKNFSLSGDNTVYNELKYEWLIEYEKKENKEYVEFIKNIKSYKNEIYWLRDNWYIKFDNNLDNINLRSFNVHITITDKWKIFLKNSKKCRYLLNMYMEDLKWLSMLVSIIAILISIIALCWDIWGNK